MKAKRLLAVLSISILAMLSGNSPAQVAEPAPDLTPRAQQARDAILLTIFLKHDQSMNVNEIYRIQEQQEFFKKFPPPGTRVVSWYVMMGIGQVVTLEVPASKLREVNLAIEKTAWKAFRTEFYPTYDLYPVVKDKLSNKEKLGL